MWYEHCEGEEMGTHSIKLSVKQVSLCVWSVVVTPGAVLFMSVHV